MLDGDGKDCGAVYSPEEEIVPLTEFPPATPLTLQFTPLELAPVTVAVNCCVWPSGTDAVAGCTVTVTFGGGFDEEELVSPQPEMNATPAAIAAQQSANAKRPPRLTAAVAENDLPL